MISAAVYQDKPELFTALLRFNYPTADELVRGRLSDRQWKMLQKLSRRATEERQREVTAHVLWAKSDFYENFSKESTRLALLPPNVLLQLLKWVGAIVHYRQVAQAVSRTEVMALRKLLGETLYEYLLFEAPQFMGEEFEWLEQLDSGKSLFWQIRQHGVDIVGHFLYQMSTAGLVKLTPRLPLVYDKCRKSIFADLPRDDEQRLWLLVKGILLTEIDPSWKNCFD